MKALLAVTLSSDPGGPAIDERSLAQAVGCLNDSLPAEPTLRRTDDGWIAFAGTDPGDLTDPAGGFTVRLGRAARTRTRDVATTELPAMIANGAALTDLLPPFAAAHRPAPGAPIMIAGDWLGFHQLYWWRGPGVSAVSTSARALSILAGGALDPAGLGAQALIGWQIGDATLFAGVHTFGPATIATLHRGGLDLRRYAEPPARPATAPQLDEAVEAMAAILVQWQTAYLDDHPDAMLQLTGGHDSRILLAAIPEQRRAGIRALTLGNPDSPDVMIAAQLVERFGMAHQVYRLDEQRRPTPAETHALALAAARELECAASPLALAPLLLAESHLEQGHRLGGLGGEVARGFYYAGQPAHATTSPHLVDRLARWRLFSNEAVEADAFEPAFLDHARATTLGTLHGLFGPGDWLRSTDDFYLMQRMHRWAGVHGTVAAIRRHYINPMFDRTFVELALAVAPGDKRDSMLLGRLMRRLDPELARVPLDSGLVPARLGTRSVFTRLSTGTVTARKMVRKVHQRVTRGRRAQLGAADAAALVLEHWRAEPAACEALYGVPLLRAGWLDRVLSGSTPAQPTTVAFLINLLAATDRTARAPVSSTA
ncbi:hemophore-related protein [Microlunatus parietis]|uniref:Asparagine synthase (Glutamine-hydrolyzing) n=1 Tax=Microlunatus parietis TaxID=682979 RepID=A0A7Y9IAD2_9ACTN|nr:hemophore-related protein [Microlunatus parietis]NYE73030.1 asparagine synthase (glutamine-hydrolyzing) [Microlunatus parietis]